MRKLLKISGIILLVILTILTVLYFYITNNAEKLIKSFIASQSDGRFSVDFKKIDFNLRSLRLEVIEPHLLSIDSVNLPTTYDVKLDRLILDLSAIGPLVFNSKVHVDTLILMRPVISATKWKDKPTEKFSLTEQMGKAYTVLEKIIQNLNIKYCVIDSGHLTIADKLNKNHHPVSITDFYVRIDNFAPDSKKDTSDRYLFTDRIRFYSSHQDIVFPDGNHGLKYSRLRINSLRQSIEIDSCYIYGKQPGDGFKEFGVFFDTLKLSQVDFNKLTHSQLIKADSAICRNPIVTVHNELKPKNNKPEKAKRYNSRDSMELAFKALFGDIDINYIGVLNARFDMQTKAEDRTISYTSPRNDFIIKDVIIIKDPEIPLKIGSLYFGLNAYTAYNKDSSYALKFDSIIFRDRKCNLVNFAIYPTAKNKDIAGRKLLKMQSLEIEEFIWLELIFNKKLLAREVAMVNPEISFNLQGNKSTASTASNTNIYAIMHKLLETINFKTLKIKDARVDVNSGKKNHYAFENVNIDIGAEQVLNSNNINEFVSSITNVSFSKGELMLGNNAISLGQGIINGKAKTMRVSRAGIRNVQKSSSAMLDNLLVENFSQAGTKDINIGKLSWSKGKFVVDLATGKDNKKTTPRGRGINLLVDRLEGGNTSLKIITPGMNADVLLDDISSNRIYWEAAQKPTIEGLVINGKSILLKNKTLNLASANFKITDREPSFLNQLNILSIGKKDTISVKSPQWVFTPNINSIIDGSPAINNITIKNPEIRINPTGDTLSNVQVAKKTMNLPVLSINKLSIVNPVLVDLPASVSKTINASDHKSEWHFTDISTKGNQLSIGGMQSSIQGFSAKTKKLDISVQGEGALNINIGAIQFAPANSENPASWSAAVHTVSANDIALKTSRNDSVQKNIHLRSFHAENMVLKSSDKRTIRELLKNNEMFRMSRGHVSITSAKSNMTVAGLHYDHYNKKLSFDSFYVHPAMDRDSFLKGKKWETDYMQFSTGKTEIWGLDHELFFSDSIIYARKIVVRNPDLSVFKDKRLPFNFSRIKPLPASMILNIKKRIKIDTIRIHNADIHYEEFNDKTEMTGNVQFNRTEMLIENVRNFDISETDSLKVSATTWMMDSAYIRLRFNESYTDTLNAFLFAVRIRPFNLTVLNPLIEPVVSAKIISGKVDTIHLNAIGREYVAHGKMRMYYHGLKAQYLNKGDDNVKTLKTRLITFAANDLILHDQKTRGYGEVYAERIRERSVINYWLKMATSGLMSSTGVKSNKKQIKKYKRSIRKLNVPEIPEVSL